MDEIAQIIQKFGLLPLPGEGGYFSETYRLHNHEIGKSRALNTAIYYFITPNDFSALHKLKSDEIFHFYAGDRAEMVQISPDGQLKSFTLGNAILAGDTPQVVVPHDTWQGTRLKTGGKWALLGTTCAPGFEFTDFELGSRAELTKEFSQHAEIIKAYTTETT